MKKVILFLIGIVVAGGLFYGLQGSSKDQREARITLHPIATVTLGNGQQFKVELYPEEAPNTVNNFIALVKDNYYSDLTFNKILPDYLLQTGDKIGDGTGFPGYFIPSECSDNGYKNDLPLDEGVVCMSRGQKYNTEGSQFFILLSPRRDLEGTYAAFGKVTEGLEFLKEMSKMAPDELVQREEGLQVSRIEVDTFGKYYGEPQVLSLAEVRELK